MPYKVLHYVSIMDRAGQETFIMNVFRTIDRNIITFDFLVTQNREGEYDNEIYKLGGQIRHYQPITSGSPLKRLKNAFLLQKYLKTINKDYSTIHIHTQHALDAVLDAMAAKFAGFHKVIVHSHSTNTLHHVKAHFICRPILNHLPIVRLACSEKAGEWLFGSHGKYEIINNGIVTKDFLYDTKVRNRIREEEGWNGKTVVGHVGSFLYPKNHTFLLDIFKSYLNLNPNALLVMAGKGELMDEIKEKTRNLGLTTSVIFLGSCENVNQLYSAFDVLLFPSHYEGLPVTLVEAQASDLPCLISDVITKETDIIPKIRRMNLNKNAEEWAKVLLEMSSSIKREDVSKLIVDAGYDIGTTTKRLSHIYSE